jgi:hypothetical protein
MRHPGRVGMMLIVIMGLMGGVARVTAYKDPCHQRHACPSDTGSYVCGDRGRCEQCPDNQYCLAGKPRLAASPSPALAAQYTANWQAHAEHSQPYIGRGVR